MLKPAACQRGGGSVPPWSARRLRPLASPTNAVPAHAAPANAGRGEAGRLGASELRFQLGACVSLLCEVVPCRVSAVQCRSIAHFSRLVAPITASMLYTILGFHPRITIIKVRNLLQNCAAFLSRSRRACICKDVQRNSGM